MHYSDEASPDVLNDDDHELIPNVRLPGHEEAVLSNGLRTRRIIGYKYISLNLN